MKRQLEFDKAFAIHLAKSDRLNPNFACRAEMVDKRPIYDDTPITKEYLDEHYTFNRDAPYLRLTTVGDL